MNLMSMFKRMLKAILPSKVYQHLYAAKEYLRQQSRTDYKVLRGILKDTFAPRSRRTTSWQEVLPMQAPQRFQINKVAYHTFGGLIDELNASDQPYYDDGVAIYLPPTTLRATPFRMLARYYPPNVGLKIFKAAPDLPETGSSDRSDRCVDNKQPSPSGARILVANLLYESKLGPRLYDSIELELGDTVWRAYVVEHIEGSRRPTVAECEKGLGRIRRLEAGATIACVKGYDDIDFQCPGCNGNAIVDANGTFRYLRFENFALGDYQTYLKQVAARSIDQVHFGEESLLRRGRFLYQSVPGVRLPAKRSTEDRTIVIDRLMDSAGCTVGGRLVLDIGCNAGMMMAEYLKRGARWCHGWDTEAITPHAETLLLALGCTRFSTTGAFLERTRPLEEDLPDFARSLLPGCIISYLAVRLHLGWLNALAYIPWSFLIYEGHQYETQEDFARHIAPLRKLADVEVLTLGAYKEGFSNERVVAILTTGSYRH